jgi:hypothetical protein
MKSRFFFIVTAMLLGGLWGWQQRKIKSDATWQVPAQQETKPLVTVVASAERFILDEAALRMAAGTDEMAVAQLICDYELPQLREVASFFANLPDGDPCQKLGLQMALFYWSRLDAVDAIQTLFSWTELAKIPTAVTGVFSGVRHAEDAQWLTWLKQAEQHAVIGPALLGLAQAHPIFTLEYLRTHEVAMRSTFKHHETHSFDSMVATAAAEWTKRNPREAIVAKRNDPFLHERNAWSWNAMKLMVANRYPELVRELVPEFYLQIDLNAAYTVKEWLARLSRKELLKLWAETPSLLSYATDLLKSWAQEDFTAASTWLMQLPLTQRDGAFEGMVSGSSGSQWFAVIDAMPRSPTRENYEQQVLESLVKENPALALEELHRLVENKQESFIRNHLPSLVAQDSQALINYLGAHPEWKLRLPDESERNTVFSKLTPESAERYFDLFPDSPEKLKLQTTWQAEQAFAIKSTPEVAFAKILETNPDRFQAGSTMLKAMLNNYSSVNTKEAARWLEQQPVQEQTALLEHAIKHENGFQLYGLLQASPDDLFSKMIEVVPDDEKQLERMKSDAANLVLSMNYKMPAAELAQWSERLPQNEVTVGVRVKAAEIWLSTDPQAASSWVRGWPEGPAKDQAAGHIFSTTLHEDEPTAMAWLDTIRDVKLKNLTLQKAAITILWINREKARSLADKINTAEHRAFFDLLFKRKN